MYQGEKKLEHNLSLVCKMTKGQKKQSTIRKSKQSKELLKKEIEISNQPIIQEVVQKYARIFKLRQKS